LEALPSVGAQFIAPGLDRGRAGAINRAPTNKDARTELPLAMRLFYWQSLAVTDEVKKTRPVRRSIRLQHYDYSQPGSYFVTIVAHQRQCLFGEIVEGIVRMGGAGEIVCELIEKISARVPSVTVDPFLIMPNHFHAILNVGAKFIAPESSALNSAGMNRAPTLGQILRAIKAASTVRIRRQCGIEHVWQRNYYEHVIRNEESLNRIRQYILDNPLKWERDPENPQATSPEPLDAWRVSPVASFAGAINRAPTKE
jgi:REP element-mobilizing transposase RayT